MVRANGTTATNAGPTGTTAAMVNCCRAYVCLAGRLVSSGACEGFAPITRKVANGFVRWSGGTGIGQVFTLSGPSPPSCQGSGSMLEPGATKEGALIDRVGANCREVGLLKGLGVSRLGPPRLSVLPRAEGVAEAIGLGTGARSTRAAKHTVQAARSSGTHSCVGFRVLGGAGGLSISAKAAAGFGMLKRSNATVD